MSTYQKITDQLRGQVEMFTLCEVPPRAIAVTLGITRSKVSRIQQSLGLNPRRQLDPIPLETIEKIISLYRTNGAPSVARKLGLSLRRVYAVVNAYNLPRPARRSGRSRLRQQKVEAAKKSVIRERFVAFEKQIAAEFAVSLGWVRTFLRRRRT